MAWTVCRPVGSAGHEQPVPSKSTFVLRGFQGSRGGHACAQGAGDGSSARTRPIIAPGTNNLVALLIILLLTTVWGAVRVQSVHRFGGVGFR